MAYLRVLDFQSDDEPTIYDALVLGRKDGEQVNILLIDTDPSLVTTFDDAPVGSIAIDRTNAKKYFKTTATEWVSDTGLPDAVTDPGDGEAIPVTYMHASIAITTAAAETNTLAIPTVVGQTLHLYCDTYAVGDRVITAASGVNQTGNNTLTFGAARDAIKLEAITVGGALAWNVVYNDGVGLSTGV